MSSFASILEREPATENIVVKKVDTENAPMDNAPMDNAPMDNAPIENAILDNSNSINNSIQDLDKTIIPQTPIDFVKKSNTDSSIPSTNEIQYREFQSNINNFTSEKENDTAANSVIEEQKEVIVSDVGGNDRGGIVYDIIHILDDVYSYGRTVIENNYFNFANNDDFNLVYPNIYIGNYSTSTNLELLKNVGITHIISVIPTCNPPFPDKFKYLHIQAYDDQTQDLSQHFVNCNAFIGNVLEEGGKVLIHCMVGRSRSVTVFLAFLIHIIRGNFNQSIVNLISDNDVSNEAEYKQFGKSRNSNIKYSNIKYSDIKYSDIKYSDIKYTNSRTDTVNDSITTHDYIKPKLSNKYHSFMNYKKETMIHQVEELIEKYKLLQKEINIFSDDIVPVKSIEQLKQQFANNFIVQILTYIKTYRPIASPNPYFISQLIDLLM